MTKREKKLEKIIVHLWDVLDNIDTYSELQINGTDEDFIFSKIMKKCGERFKYVQSNGYDLFIDKKNISNRKVK